MSLQKEVACPLCMDEMDLTDQQFNPCKCGYQICVWCWNHMVEEAEKDGVLCPACRNPYDTDMIRGMTVGRDRLACINSRGKPKMTKPKPKTSEMRYEPDEIRVIQRNLVYITGIPVDLANDETIRRREFFGQYGKILKIFIKPSRPDSHHYNKSSTVYLTYSEEDEAIRCIQIVNGFVLNGSPLKACYGTTRYCHTWLQKKLCKNPDCSYLHYAVPQGDICTKDEVASACASKLQKCMGTALLVKRRSGSFLPPALDCYCISTAKPRVSSVSLDPFYRVQNLQSADNVKAGALSRASSCLPVISDSATHASNAVWEGPLNTSSTSSSSFTSASAEADLQEQDCDEYYGKEQIFMPASQTQGLGGPENHEASQPFCSSGYDPEYLVPTCEASPGNNTMIQNTVNKLSCLDDNITERIVPDTHHSVLSKFKQSKSIASDLTRQASSNIICSQMNKMNCASSSSLCHLSPRECPVNSIQVSHIPNLQDITLGSTTTSQKVHPHFNMCSGFSDLEQMKLASSSEFKGTCMFSRSVNTCDTGVIIGEQASVSTFPDNVIGNSNKEKLHTRHPGNHKQDFAIKDREHSSDHKMMKHVNEWNKTGVVMRKDEISGETYVEPRECSVKSISSPNHCLVKHLANLQNPSDHANVTIRAGDCSNSGLPARSADSGANVTILGGAKHNTSYSHPVYTDAFGLNKEYRQLNVVGKKAVSEGESINRLTVNDFKNLELHTSKCGYSTTPGVNESQHLLRLPQPASSISKSVISPPPKFPPGFPPRHAFDEGQSCSRHSSSGNPQLQFSGNRSLINVSPKKARSNSYFSIEPIDVVKLASRREPPHPTTHLASPCYNSTMIRLGDSDQRVRYQSNIGSFYGNLMDEDQSKTYLGQGASHGMMPYQGSTDACTFGRPTATDPRVICKRGQTERSNTASSGVSVLHHQFLQPFSAHNYPEFQGTDSGHLYC